MDAVTWQALTAVLTLLGAVLTVVLWRRRGTASGLRALAWTLLPAAAYLTGTLRLGWEVADAVVSWAVRFAFSPLVWLGIALAGVSAVLFVASGLLRRRAPRRTAARRTAARPTKAAERRPAAPDRPAIDSDDDLDDVEAILRKHGIT